MKFANRILKVKPSPTMAVTAKASQLKAQGFDVIGFGSGEPDFDTPVHIKEAAIRAIEEGKTKYTPAGGLPELKKAIAGKFKRDNNLNYELSQITVNCGAKQSIYNLMQILINDGDEVIIPAPYWVSYPDMAELAGGIPVIVHTDIENDFKMTPSQLKENITRRTKTIIINSPSNPTGSGYSKDELTALADVIEGTDIIVISDDIYESIVYNGFEFSNIANVSEAMKQQSVIINGVSKSYAMTGWRIGYMAGNENIIKKAEILQSQSTSNPSSISQWASIAALNGDQEVVKDMVKAFDRRRQFVIDELNTIPGISCYDPSGAFYAFPRVDEIFKLDGWKKISENYDDEFNSSKLATYLLEEARTAVVPGIGFGNDNYFRMSFATSDANLKEGLSRIKEAIGKLV